MKKITFFILMGLVSIQAYAGCFKLLDKSEPLVFRNDCSFNIIPAVCVVGENCGGYGNRKYLVEGERGNVSFSVLIGAKNNNGYPQGLIFVILVSQVVSSMDIAKHLQEKKEEGVVHIKKTC